MPFIRLSVFKCYTLLAISISLNKKIMSPYSYYTKKGLVYIIIINPFSRQPFFYIKCTKLNAYILYNIHSVSFNKYAFFCYARHYTY